MSNDAIELSACVLHPKGISGCIYFLKILFLIQPAKMLELDLLLEFFAP